MLVKTLTVIDGSTKTRTDPKLLEQTLKLIDLLHSSGNRKLLEQILEENNAARSPE